MGNDTVWKSLVLASIVFFFMSAFGMYMIVNTWSERLGSHQTDIKAIRDSAIQRQDQIIITMSRIDLMDGRLNQNNIRIGTIEERANNMEHRMNEFEKAMKKNKTSMLGGSIDSNALGTR